MNILFVVFIGIGIVLALTVGFLWLNDRLFYRRNRDRNSPKQKRQDEMTLAARLETPKWDEIEQITKGRPSPALTALYADMQLIHRKDLYIRNPAPGPDQLPEECILSFRAADAVALRDDWCQFLPQGAFPFATDLFGDLLYVELTPTGGDLPVKHWFHDSRSDDETIEIIAPSLAVFLRWERSDTPLPTQKSQ
jgi:hypothetical protein